MQCGPYGPSWTWTQIGVQAFIPDYSLNWTARSSAIQVWQRCQWWGSPTRRWSGRTKGPFGLKSAIEHWPAGADARMSAENASARRTVTDRISIFFSTTYKTGLDKRSMTEGRIIVGIKGKGGRTLAWAQVLLYFAGHRLS